MALKYALFENHLTPDPDDYMAVVQDVDSFTLDRILEEMVVPGGVTSVQAAAVLESFMLAQEKILKNGNAINTEMYNIYPSISGVFDSEEDSFNDSRHRVKMNASLGTRFSDIGSQVDVSKVDGQSPMPMLRHFIDSATGRKDEIVTIGKVGEIQGINLKLDPTDTNQGVFFISGTDEYRATSYIRNTHGNLIFFIPEGLPAGECKVEVRTIMWKMKEIRTGALSDVLTAVS